LTNDNNSLNNEAEDVYQVEQIKPGYNNQKRISMVTPPIVQDSKRKQPAQVREPNPKSNNAHYNSAMPMRSKS